MRDLSKVSFDNSFVRALPADESTLNVPREVLDGCYTFVNPTPVHAPKLLAWSNEVGALLGIAPPRALLTPAVEALAGNRVFPSMKPYASRYGGHQFGHWAGQLGDGRAITLGEVVNAQGQRWELQLKGAGLTPYSRTADGLAVLRSSVREFLCSEAMHHLGVPTTRALSLVATGESVVRDMFYDGHPRLEPGAIVCRVAPSFVRFGHFEILTASTEIDNLKQLADYIILQHFPDLGAPSPEIYALWFQEICRRTAIMVAHWMRVGFVHGVMNTDNMSILGLTIDYGPYGWLEGYDPYWTPNTTDARGRRYCYGRQPQIAFWNVQRLAEALSSLIPDTEALEQGLTLYKDTFESAYWSMFAAKLGLQALEGDEDHALLADVLQLLERVETDMTIFFRRLADVPVDASHENQHDAVLNNVLSEALYSEQALSVADQQAWIDWLKRYRERVQQDAADPIERRERMQRTNPKYVLRNYLAQQAIDAAEKDDPSLIQRLLDVLKRPYDEQPEHEELARKRPEWARNKAGCSMLSCSS